MRNICPSVKHWRISALSSRALCRSRPKVPDGLGNAKGAVVNAKPDDARFEIQDRSARDVADFRGIDFFAREPLGIFCLEKTSVSVGALRRSTVTQQTVYHAGDQLRTAVHDEDRVMQPVGRCTGGIAFPTGLP